MSNRPHLLSLPRFARGLALAALVLAAPSACEKGGGGGTVDPGTGGAGTSEPSKSGTAFAYAETFALDATVDIDFQLATPEGPATAKLAAKTRLEGAAAGGGKIKVHGKLAELVSFTGTGTMAPDHVKAQMEKQGTKDFDLVAALKASEDWSVVDSLGESDDEATKALPENAAKKPDMSAAEFGVFALPNLPPVALELGKQTKLPTEEKEENMFGQPIPLEIDQTWTLVEVVDQGGHQVAKLEAKVESSGAAEMSGQGGSAMISVFSESTFVLHFDLTSKLPVSYEGESMFELSFEAGGQSGTVSNTTKMKASYVAG